ncbi:tripartite tricarboxylate transporter permease [Streptomyces sp. NPDC006332]|uniref:tripartite tricarboxylate transporter permease n=1 Tax=Streptomyces sp. NPDC006332 TaxID=3155456 RepID=UPI0033ABB72A
MALAVGLFAVAEVLFTTCTPNQSEQVASLHGRVGMTRDDWRRSWRPWLRGTVLGVPFGAMPAGGAEIPTFLSYNIERRLAKRRKERGKGEDEFGRGAIEGVAGPEAANNAAFSGVLMPLLTLGIPTSATAGVLLIAFQIYNLQPGPQLFEQQSTLVWTLIASLYIGNVMLLVLNLPMVRIWVRLLRLPAPVLSAGILCFALLGVYALSQSTFEMMIAIGVAVLGLCMRRAGYPIAPLILGAVLGPLMEAQFRRALAFSEGDPAVFLTRPASAAILSLALVALVGPVLLRRRTKVRLPEPE